MDNQALLRRWNAAHSERQKLQHAYLLIAVVSFVVAAVSSLINQHFGRAVLVVTIASLAAFVANAVIWALLYSNAVSTPTGVKSRQTRR